MPRKWIGNVPQDIEELSTCQKKVKEKRTDEIARVCEDFRGEKKTRTGVSWDCYHHVEDLGHIMESIGYDDLFNGFG